MNLEVEPAAANVDQGVGRNGLERSGEKDGKDEHAHLTLDSLVRFPGLARVHRAD